MNPGDFRAFAERHVSDEAINRFEQDGAIILRQVVPEEWIERMREAIDAVLAGPGQFSSEMEPSSKGRQGLAPLGEIVQTAFLRSAQA